MDEQYEFERYKIWRKGARECLAKTRRFLATVSASRQPDDHSVDLSKFQEAVSTQKDLVPTENPG